MIPGRQFAALQIQGARPYQEDDFGCVNDLKPEDARPTDLLVVLADGMGGHAGGAQASRVAVRQFIESYRRNTTDVVSRFEKALQEANEAIQKEASDEPKLQGMGCTLVGVSFTDEGVLWISVGDSPFWRIRGKEIKQLNADHSMAPVIAMQVSNGELSREEAALHPQRNALRSALVGEPIPQTDLRETPIRVRDGDRFVLASDGLQTLKDAEIAEIMSRDADALDLARDLVDAVEAKNRRGQDNTTVIVVAPTIVGDQSPIIDWSR